MTNGIAVQAPDGSYRRMAQASLGSALFMKSGHGIGRGNGLPDEIFHRRRALAYVAGAWTRSRRGKDFGFANAKEKATLVAQLLTDLGCRGVSLESTFGYIPQSNVVHFTPTDDVREWRGRKWQARSELTPSFGTSCQQPLRAGLMMTPVDLTREAIWGRPEPLRPVTFLSRWRAGRFGASSTRSIPLLSARGAPLELKTR